MPSLHETEEAGKGEPEEGEERKIVTSNSTAKKVVGFSCLGLFVFLVVLGTLVGNEAKKTPSPTSTTGVTVKPSRSTARPTPTPTLPEPSTPPAETPTADAPTADISVAEDPAESEEPDPVHYKNCAAVRAAGAAPIHRGEPGYAPHLDRDNDGIACDS